MNSCESMSPVFAFVRQNAFIVRASYYEQRGRRAFSYCQRTLRNPPQINYPPGTVRAVGSHCVVRHVNHKGGYLIFRVPNPSCIYFKILSLFGKKKKWVCYKDSTHVEAVMLTTPKKWRELLKKNDFDCKIIGIPPTNFIKKLMYKLDIFLTFKPFYLLNHSVILQCKRL